MITVSQKCQYALRAIFELAKRAGEGFVIIADIASAQAIPPRFLELILNELKQSGFITSRRGALGGYTLTVEPKDLTVGQIVRLIDGPIQPVKCVAGNGSNCPLLGNCVFKDIWTQAEQATSSILDNTTFQDLLDKHRQQNKPIETYSI